MYKNKMIDQTVTNKQKDINVQCQKNINQIVHKKSGHVIFVQQVVLRLNYRFFCDKLL